MYFPAAIFSHMDILHYSILLSLPVCIQRINYTCLLYTSPLQDKYVSYNIVRKNPVINLAESAIIHLGKSCRNEETYENPITKPDKKIPEP